MNQDQPDLRSIWAFLDKLAFRQDYVDAAGVRTRYIQAGPKDAPPLIMVHGMGGSWENFIANVAAHAEHFNVIAFDLLGHGYSAKPDKVYEVRDYVAQLVGLIEALQLKKVRLLGLSIGGWISTKLTSQRPDLVEKLLVLSAWGRSRGVVTPEIHASMVKILEQRLKAVDEPSFQAMDEVFDGLIADPADRMRDLLALRLRIYQQPEMPRTMRHVFGGVTSPEIYDRNILTDEELRNLKRPTMVVACVDHPDLFLKSAYEYKALIPGVEFVELKRASHWPQWETADELNRLSLDFFRAP